MLGLLGSFWDWFEFTGLTEGALWVRKRVRLGGLLGGSGGFIPEGFVVGSTDGFWFRFTDGLNDGLITMLLSTCSGFFWNFSMPFGKGNRGGFILVNYCLF